MVHKKVGSLGIAVVNPGVGVIFGLAPENHPHIYPPPRELPESQKVSDYARFSNIVQYQRLHSLCGYKIYPTSCPGCHPSME